MDNWEIWLLQPIIVAIVIASPGVFYFLLKIILKRRPTFEMEFERSLPWANYPNPRQEEAYLISKGIDHNKEMDILSMKVPDETHFKRFNTTWRKWYLATGDYRTIKNFTPKLYRKFKYSFVRNNKKNLGPWIMDIISRRNVWFIFNFQDDYHMNEWCYCKRFRAMELIYPWKEERQQIRNKLKSWKLFKHKECKNCIFQSKWDTKDLSDFEEEEADIVVKSMLDTVITPQDILEEGHQLEMIDETEINTTDVATVVKPEWVTLFEKEIVNVPSAGHEKLPSLSLKEGDLIQGIIFETVKDPFNLYVMNEDEYGKYLEGDEFSPLEDGDFEEISSVRIDFVIPHDGIWYFVFDTFGKKIEREIEVSLRRLPSK